MLLKTAMITIAAILFTSVTAFSQNSNLKEKKNQPAFPQLAYSGGMMEVQLGKLAQQKASSYKVKEFGERMINDHSKANAELKKIAQKNNIMLPGNMLPENQNTYNELSAYTGSEFDNHYMNKMVEDHKEDITAFENASEKADNVQIRQWARKTLPVLRQHLKLAEKTVNGLTKSR